VSLLTIKRWYVGNFY